MEYLEKQLITLLAQINGGQAGTALPELAGLLEQRPGHPAILALIAEAYRLSGRTTEAIEAYKRAAEQGAGARNWLAAGITLAGERNIDEALRCLMLADADAPESDDVLDALITTLFNSSRFREGVPFARRQLTNSRNPHFLSNAALILQSNELYEESSNAFKKIIQLFGDDPAVTGAALVPARFTCEWEWITLLQEKIRACYARGDFCAPREYPLTHVTWCTDEACNLAVTKCYVEKVQTSDEYLTITHTRRPSGRIRVGYLSCDFRNHATMHLMASLFEYHDRKRFEVFAYDFSAPDVSDYRQRFLNAIEHHVEIHSLSDKNAALRIAEDQLDILFDLKGHTGGARPGIAAYRPAPLQVAYLGYPGSTGTANIDYIVSDQIVTPNTSIPYYTEKFCRLPHSYQCNDRNRAIATNSGTRADHGLPEVIVVFGAFNQPYKIDRLSFEVWMRVLIEVPDSVLWLLGQCESAIKNLSHYAQLAGVMPERLIFAPFAAPHEHLARLQLVDAVLDTLVCNGHTTTSDALWSGVPVITARGKHFASRVSESLLNAMALPELVGKDPDDMVQIAKRIGMDREFRGRLREKVMANRLNSPLFDTQRFTRNFEKGIEMMVARHGEDSAGECIDVPDQQEAGISWLDTNDLLHLAAPLQTRYQTCPLCEALSFGIGSTDCTRHPLWHEPLPKVIEWMRCSSCEHIHSQHYWTESGLTELFLHANPNQLAGISHNHDAKRALWAPVVDKVVGLLGGYRAALRQERQPTWMDVGCGDGALFMTASDYGFSAFGLDARVETVNRLQALGFNAQQGDFINSKVEVELDVISMMDVIEHTPYPRSALRKAVEVLRPNGVLVISMPDLECSTWKAMDDAGENPYWMEIEHHHNFSRTRISDLLDDTGFEIVGFSIPQRYKAQMELYARRK